MKSVHNHGLVFGTHIKDGVLNIRYQCVGLFLLFLHIFYFVSMGWWVVGGFMAILYVSIHFVITCGWWC